MDPKSILQATQAVCQGNMPLHPRIARHLFRKMGQSNGQKPTQCLTEREEEVLHQLVQGLSNKSIAQTLSLTEGTVKRHISHILTKLKVSNRTEAAVQAVQRGLVSLNEVK